MWHFLRDDPRLQFIENSQEQFLGQVTYFIIGITAHKIGPMARPEMPLLSLRSFVVFLQEYVL